jgi:hypothetical protein
MLIKGLEWASVAMGTLLLGVTIKEIDTFNIIETFSVVDTQFA